MTSTVFTVSLSPTHGFSKAITTEITLLIGQGVEGDAHCGVTVKHRSRVKQDPTQPNLRQIHLIHSELFQELADKGFSVAPGALGENICTSGIALLELPVDTELRFGQSAVIKLTGLRNPCAQIDQYQPGLLPAVLSRTAEGELVRIAGVMAVVIQGGVVRPGDSISTQLPSKPHKKLERV